jgi:hypothetical protein
MTKIEYNDNDKNDKDKDDDANNHVKESAATPLRRFNLPITFIANKRQIEKHMLTDLELAETDTTKSLYEYVFMPTDIFSKRTIPLWNKYYTSDKTFIKETQRLLKTIRFADNGHNDNADNADINNKVADIWEEMKKETGFKEKYHYIDWIYLEHYNNNAQFLQLMSFYNMTSPILTLMLPIFFLILPFFILKLQGIPVTMTKYIEILQNIFKNHPIGQLLNIGNAEWDKLGYLAVSLVFYILQIYQNMMSCVRFYHNMKKIHEQLFTMRDYLKKTLDQIETLRAACMNLTTYQLFMVEMEHYEETLKEMFKEFNSITPNTLSLKKIMQIGHVMKCFYQLYQNDKYQQALEYSFGLNGYMGNIQGLQKNISLKNIALCKLNKKKTAFKGAYFPTLVNEQPVKNNYDLNKHMLITGPNAAGKTTMLKTTIFNILLSQQVGGGFYDSAKLHPYDIIHCYINIPDTSARDSLFQSEARRCKHILTDITEHEAKIRHFCVFDELYSGTNPYEAIGSAYAFLKYLNKHKNVRFILTTHFLDLCKRLDKEETIQNYNMQIKIDNKQINTNKQSNTNTNFIYTYKLQEGISEIKGGIKVLSDLHYPLEIIEETLHIIKELII